MTISHPHLDALEKRHQDLHDAVSAEERRPYPDAKTLGTLKRQKLKAKDAVEAFRSELLSETT